MVCSCSAYSAAVPALSKPVLLGLLSPCQCVTRPPPTLLTQGRTTWRTNSAYARWSRAGEGGRKSGRPGGTGGTDAADDPASSLVRRAVPHPAAGRAKPDEAAGVHARGAHRAGRQHGGGDDLPEEQFSLGLGFLLDGIARCLTGAENPARSDKIGP